MSRTVNGRPRLHNDKLEAKVLALLSEKSMVKVCAMKGMPSRQTIYEWIEKIPGFSDRYDKACQERADHRAEMIDEIADQVLKGEVDPRAGRVAIDAHKWTASKLNRKYGDRVQTEHSGSIDVSGLSDEELNAKIQAYLSSNG